MDLLQRTHDIAAAFLRGVRDRRVNAKTDYVPLVEALGGKLPESGEDAERVVQRFVNIAEAGLMATPGPRYFGLVIGGAVPAALAADWLTSTWDQNAFSYATSPAAAAVEEVCRRWLAELLGLSPDVSMGIVTGSTMANFAGLAAARHAVLERAGWKAEEQGLFGAPVIDVITSDESHATVFAALQMLGLGRSRVTRLATDDQGRMRSDALSSALHKANGPLIVCAQAGNVNTGSFDPLPEIAGLVHDHAGWLHVDGAFGAWAAASSRLRHLTKGMSEADSVSVDGHKWLNVPYDCGFVFTRHPVAHGAAMTLDASYYPPTPDEARNNGHFVPESSRRARGFTVYAALRSLGCRGIEEIVDRCCALARRMAEQLAKHERARILNDVVLNQVLVRFEPAGGGDADAFTKRVIQDVQDDGTCWLGGATWHGMQVMRVSVSNWSTTAEDIDRSAQAILRFV